MQYRLEETVVDEYRTLAASYDRRWARYVQASAEETLRRADLGGCQSVLDIACGTGSLLQQIGELYPRARLHGADLSGEMLQVACARLGPTVRLYRARADALPFADNAFDAVVSTNSFHLFTKPEAALAEMKRVLVPGGRLVITDWCDDYWTCRLCDLILRAVGRAHHRLYGRTTCRALVEAAGFSNVELASYKIDWFWGLMTATASPAADGRGAYRRSNDPHKRM